MSHKVNCKPQRQRNEHFRGLARFRKYHGACLKLSFFDRNTDKIRKAITGANDAIASTMPLLYQDLVMDQGLAARVSEKLTQPITAMGSNVSSTVRCVCRCAREFFLRYVPSIREEPVYQGISWKPTWSSVPNSGRIPGLKDSFSLLKRE
ncbi:hypothetical protein V6N12_013012 [Hibiscus sabdariffa]|uniref:Uncharacterized protein n=2 Tax=Hibiscus sabdariffa TaxID=183260 RepID=A0ABR2EG25_9ROSI